MNQPTSQEIYRKVIIKSTEDLPKESEKRYYVHIKGDFNLRSVRIPSASYRALRKKIDWYLIAQPSPDSQVREELIKSCMDELLKHLFPMKHSNGYPSEAVPKATILELPALMRTYQPQVREEEQEGQSKEIHIRICDARKDISDVAKDIQEEYFHDDDFSGGYIESPGKDWVADLYTIEDNLRLLFEQSEPYDSDQPQEAKQTEVNLHFLRSNILRNLTKEEFIILKEWMNSYDPEFDENKQEAKQTRTAEEILLKYCAIPLGHSMQSYVKAMEEYRKEGLPDQCKRSDKDCSCNPKDRKTMQSSDEYYNLNNTEG